MLSPPEPVHLPLIQSHVYEKTPRKITISWKETDKNKNENYKFRLSVSERQSRPSFSLPPGKSQILFHNEERM
jgi:hypothetical protein